MTTEWRRFHPAAVAFHVTQALGGLLVPLAVLAIGGGGGLDRVLTYGLGGVAIAFVAAVVRWHTNQWRVSEQAIAYRSGWVSLKTRSVPLSRVQSLDAIRGPIHRLLGVAAVKVQTAGGDKAAEITLPALTTAELEALRAAAGVAVDVASETLPRRRLGAGGLVAAGLTAGSAGAIVAVGAVVGQVAQEVYGDEGRGALRHAADLAPSSGAGWVLAALGLVLAAWVLGVVGTLVAFSGFEVVRDGDRLRITRGLLSRRETSIAVRRVRAVRVVEGVLRQPLGLAAVRIDVLGAGEEPPANQTLFPLLRAAQVVTLLDELLPEHARLGALAPAPGRAWRPYVLPPAATGLAVGAVLWAAVPWAGAWALALALPPALWGVAAWRAAAVALAPTRAGLRYRRLARTTAWFDPALAQSATVAQTPLQARAGLATVRVSLGRGADADVRHLAAGDCWRLWRLGGGTP